MRIRDERVFLDKDEALRLLSDHEEIHTFRDAGACLIGADWEREELVKAISGGCSAEIGGDACRKVGHGLVLFVDAKPLFVEVDDAMVQALVDKSLELEQAGKGE